MYVCDLLYKQASNILYLPTLELGTNGSYPPRIPEENSHHGNHIDHPPAPLRVDSYGNPMTDPLPRAHTVGVYSNGGIPPRVTSPKRTTSPPVAQQPSFDSVSCRKTATSPPPSGTSGGVPGNSPTQVKSPEVVVTAANGVQNGGSVVLPQPDPTIRENVLIKRKRFVDCC